MNILIAVASRHGSTHEIAEAIAEELRLAGHSAEVRSAGDVADLTLYQAVVIGSAVYMGSWMTEARQFIDHHWPRLATRPVWFFSSGPLGRDIPQPQPNPGHLNEMMQKTRAQAHRIFVGKLDKQGLGLGERLVAGMVKAPEGDYRNWGEIRRWAREIAAALPAPTPVADPVACGSGAGAGQHAEQRAQ